MRAEWVGRDVRMHPRGPVRGTARPPGSKSIANRALLCAALADGLSTLDGVTRSGDVERMLDSLAALGIRISSIDAEALRVQGCRGYLPAADVTIDAGDAGTVMRFLSGLITLGHGRYRVDGSARMRERPIGALVSALQSLGAALGYDDRPGYPPLIGACRGLRGGEARLQDPQSSQFVSALLMVAPYAANDVYLSIEGDLPSQPYVELTMQVMECFGVAVLAEGDRFIIPAGQRYRGVAYEVEPDASAATYLWAAAAVTGGRVLVPGLTRTSLQGDVRFVDVLARMGCEVRELGGGFEVAGPRAGRLRGVDVDLNAMPDTVQTLAVVALFAEGATTIRNVANLRVKETDRLSALHAELTRCGAEVTLQSDGLTINPPSAVQPGEIATYDDHRMAMSFAIAGLAAEGVLIRDAGCVAKSFPDFFEVLNTLE